MTAPGEELVLDSSVAIKWFRLEVGSDWARGLLANGPMLIAPAWFAAECANVLWRLHRAGEPGAPDLEQALDRLLALPILRISEDDALMRAALRLAARLDHPVYDCIYLALARERDASLATADRRFAAAIHRAAALPPDRLLTPPASG